MEIWKSKDNFTSAHFADTWFHVDAPGTMFSIPMNNKEERHQFVCQLAKRENYVTPTGVSVMIEDYGPGELVEICFDRENVRMILFVKNEEYFSDSNSFVCTMMREVIRG